MRSNVMTARASASQTAVLFGGVLFFVVLDQVAKVWARSAPDSVLCNGGIALSLPAPALPTIIVSITIIILLSIWLAEHRRHALIERIGLMLLIAGGIGNTIDRIFFGCVTDFIAFFDIWHFNVADAYIAAGVAAILWHMIVVVPARHDVLH